MLRYKYTKIGVVALSALLLGGSAQGAKIGLNFQGRNSANTDGGVPLLPTDSAGVVPQTHWNNFQNWSAAGISSATDVPLNDDTGAATPITISFTANDSWNDDAPAPTATSTGDQKLMFGCIKQGGAGNTATFTYANVPAGSTGFYDLYVYTDSNNDGVRLNTAVGSQKFYTIGEHTWSGTFKQATNNVDPAFGFTADEGNYVKFSGVKPDLSGSIALTATYVSGGDGLGIAGLQLVDGASAPVDNTPPFVLLTQNPAGFIKVILTFSEALDATAADKSHFAISGGVTISDAQFVDATAANQIVLTTSAQTPATAYTVTITGVKDLAGNAGNTTATFTTPAIAAGDVKGFDTNFVLNGGATLSGNTLTLTTAAGSEARTVFYKKVVDGSKFNVQFTYRANGSADGASFTLQAAPGGTTAVGGAGGALALVTPSVAVLFNIYVPNTIGTRVSTDGTSGGYTDTAPLNLGSNHPIFVTLSYDGTTLHTKLVDGTTGDSFEASDAVDLVTILGTKYAYVGFTGATGGANSLQTITDFVYSNGTIAPAPVTITSQPADAQVLTNATARFVVETSGPATFQWFKGTTAIAGATSATLAVGPVALADDGTKYHVVVTDPNGGATITSRDANLKVGVLTLVNGFLTDELYFGFVKADVEGDLTLLPPPNPVVYRTTFQTPEGQGDNYAERVYGLFIPKVTGNYVFYLYSDDDSDLFLSTNESPDNKVVIASETSWSNINEWVDTQGNTANDASSKRSDTLFPAGIPLAVGSRYYIEVDHHEGGGGDHLGVYYNMLGDAPPANGTAPNIGADQIATYVLAGQTITFTQQPASVTNNTGTKATFTVAVQNTGASIQWQKNGTNIAGATGTSYTTDFLSLSDNGAKYRAVATIPGSSANSSDATLTVIAGTTAGHITGANGLSSTEIGVGFDKGIDPASALPASFTVSGGGVVSGVKTYTIPDPLDPTKTYGAVKLTLSTPVTGTTATVTLNAGLKDIDGLAITGTATAKINKLVSADIGTPGDPVNAGDAVSTADGSFDVYAGGSDIYNNADGFHFVYEAVTGDFDVSANVEYVLPVDNWSAGAVMVRETLDADSVQIHIKETPPSTAATVDGATGANSFEDNWRAVKAGPVAGGWGDNTGDRSAPTYPNAWIRIARVGDTLTGYRSLDGITWNQVTQMDVSTLVDADGNPAPLPANTFVGLATTSHNNSVGTKYITTVNYRGVKIIGTPSGTPQGGPKITVAKNANGSITISWDKTGKLQSASPLLNTGTVWTDVTGGGTSPVTITPAATGNLFYRVQQ